MMRHFCILPVHQGLARTFGIQLPCLGVRRVPEVNEAEGVSNNGCGIGFVFYVEGDAFLQTPSGDPGNFFNRGGDEAGNGELAET